MDSLLTSEEAARRLGVTVKTLYVYVSRGLIDSHREKGTRASYFSRADVERLATRSRRPAQLGPWSIDSAITSTSPDGFRYRGMLIDELADEPFEDVAEHLWQAERGQWSARPLAVPKGISAMETVWLGVPLAGTTDSFRSDQRPEAIVTAARRLLLALAQTLASSTRRDAPEEGSIAYFIASALVGKEPSADLVRTVNATMVLLADRSITTSMLAVRFATSARADVYSAMTAGLGVLMGPYFSAGSEALKLLRNASEVGVERAVAEELRWRGFLPGFSDPVHPDGDHRFHSSLALLEPLLKPKDRALLHELLACVERQQLPSPNVGLTLAVLVWTSAADASFGPAIFAVSRMAGWIAHYLEELEEPIGRFYPGLSYAR